MDAFERALYNGANSGLSLSGNLYCYRNPLELVGDPNDKIRNPWYDTTCCPPNLQRILASLPGYFYSTSKEGLWVHLFDNNKLNWKLEDGTPVKVTQATRYPWEGNVELTVSPETAKEFTLYVRRPSWSSSTRVEVNGSAIASPQIENGYFAVRRTWKPGDTLVLKFDMTAREIAANPLVREDIGKIAVERGPLVYCLEGIDQPANTSVLEWQLVGATTAVNTFRTEWKPDLLGGVVTLRHSASRTAEKVAEQPLYETRIAQSRKTKVAGEVTFIPYYAFHNRGLTSMAVWIPYR
jgi:DUF1680 family protein